MGVRILSDLSARMTDYRLPDGRIVQVDASASKDALVIDFQLKDGSIVQARKYPLDAISNPDEDDPEHVTLANIMDLLDKLEDRIGDKIDSAVAEILATLKASK